MKTQKKVRWCILALAIAWAICAAAEEKKAIVFTTTEASPLFTLTMPVYNRIIVADWLKILGKQLTVHPNQTVTFSDEGYFNVSDTTIVVKKEPVVTKREDGTWVISFR